MYNPLNSYLMIQQVHERADRAALGRGVDRGAWPNRRARGRGARRAR